LLEWFDWRGKSPVTGVVRGRGLPSDSKRRECGQVAEIFTVDIGVEGTRIERN
jgi:hypothetical protein